MARTANPYHSEVIGSLLRPQYLKDAIARFDKGELMRAQLDAVEDKAVLEAIALQEACDIDVIADGEMRRRGWTAPLTVSIAGYGPAPRPADFKLNTRYERSNEERQMTAMSQAVVAKLSRSDLNLPLKEQVFLQAHTQRPFKLTLPSLAHATVLWSPGTSDKVYPNKDEYLQDVLELTSQIVAECVAKGATYVQLDSPRYTHLVSDEGRANFRHLGIDPDAWLDEAIGIDNALVDRFPDVTWGLHLCRGNGPRGAWSIAGGYDPIAERLFNEIHVDRLLLEYDTPRSGSFEPLRFVPEGKVAVLGLISTKEKEIETAELLKGRLDEASRFIDLESVALSPQCGFASAFEGNMDEATQRAKLETLGRVTREVWR
jgi:5-methyltetrahydropteroyltriglutamate--homocysteine methyltransferase